MTSIGQQAFLRCYGLTSVSIGSGVKTIDSEDFSKCEGLLDVYCYAEDVPSANVNAFEGSNIKNSNLHVPAATIDSYKAKVPWKNFEKIVAFTEDETGIENIDEKLENSVVFDLSGRRVQNAQKGIYIKNGKKVLVK